MKYPNSGLGAFLDISVLFTIIFIFAIMEKKLQSQLYTVPCMFHSTLSEQIVLAMFLNSNFFQPRPRSDSFLSLRFFILFFGVPIGTYKVSHFPIYL